MVAAHSFSRPRAGQQVGGAQEHRRAFVKRGGLPVGLRGRRSLDGRGGIGVVALVKVPSRAE